MEHKMRKVENNSKWIPSVGLINEYFKKKYPVNNQNKICAPISKNLFINYSLGKIGVEVNVTLS